MEHKIGEIFEHNGEWYQCVNGGCKDCDFSKDTFYCKYLIGRDFCKSNSIFKKLEKVGEPYYSSYYKQVLQEYKYYTSPIISDTKVHILKLGIVRIEIKQNKEDMEEKKLNLKPFDLQKAKAGKPVYTRDGRKARIICFDLNTCSPYSVIAAVTNDSGYEEVTAYMEDGCYLGQNEESSRDLMMLPEKKEGWAVIRRSDIYETEEQAKEALLKSRVGAMIRNIEWEE